MTRFIAILVALGLVTFMLGCASSEPDTSTPDNYMSEGSSMEPDPELVQQKEAEMAGRSVGSREGSGGETKGGE